MEYGTIADAYRYLDNAKTTLSEKAKKDGNFYKDPKYVKMAGHTAYVGVLTALDNVLPPPKKGKTTIEYYRTELGKIDKKLLTKLNVIYEGLHLGMSYDGNRVVGNAQGSLDIAKEIIEWCERRLS
jgi:hypothetical protein